MVPPYRKIKGYTRLGQYRVYFGTKIKGQAQFVRYNNSLRNHWSDSDNLEKSKVRLGSEKMKILGMIFNDVSKLKKSKFKNPKSDH